MVFRTLARLTGGDTDLASDLTQETYRKAWQAIGEFHSSARFSSWIYRIAHNTFLNHIRTPRALVSLDDVSSPLIDESDAADEAVSRRQEEKKLRLAVLKLPEALQYVVTAHYWAELPIREIAEVERVTVVAIRKRLAKALEQLGEELRGPR